MKNKKYEIGSVFRNEDTEMVIKWVTPTHFIVIENGESKSYLKTTFRSKVKQYNFKQYE